MGVKLFISVPGLRRERASITSYHKILMQPLKIVELLILLMLANGAPLFATKIFGPRWAYPVDGNIRFVDGRQLLGPSKTVRGIVMSILATAGGAALIAIDWRLGALVGSTAMIGDLFSSFVKRRLGMQPSSKAFALDQLPEALFPVVVCAHWLSLSLVDIALTVALFFGGEIALSRLLFALGLRDRPY